MVSCPALRRRQAFANQAIRTRRRHAHLQVAAIPSRLTRKIDHPVAGGPAYRLAEPRLIALHEHFKFASHQCLVAPQSPAGVLGRGEYLKEKT